MTRTTRRILFYITIPIFLVVSYISVLYAQGYKYNFDAHTFQRTGSIQLSINKDAEIFLDNELIGSTPFLGSSKRIAGLLPGTYEVRVHRDDFSSWQKDIEVKEGLVTAFDNILILPISEEETEKIMEEVRKVLVSENIIFEPTPTPTKVVKRTGESPAPITYAPFFIEKGVLYSTTDNLPNVFALNVVWFSISENNQKVMWWTKNNEIWVQWLQSVDYQPVHNAGDRDMVIRLSSPIQRATWFRGDNHLVVQSTGFRIIEIDTRGGINIIKL